MARRRAAAVATDETSELEVIERWYRDRLTAPATLPETPWTPVALGPTWQLDGDRWHLPEHTLGWDVLAWTGRWLQLSRGEPWVFTDEQARFVLHWYAITPDGRFVYRDGVLQRLKGWGKDPVGAVLSSVELVGPCRFGGFEHGRPVAVPCPDAWVQTAAVALEQTKNTMRLLPGLFTDEAKAVHRVAIGKETVYAGASGERFMQAVTSSPTTLEGARATFVLPNETQHWFANNDGHDMADVIERNATKSPDGSARSLRITNAYEPGLDSVAERDREAWEASRDGRAVDAGLLYDSLEAPPEAPLTAEAAPSVVESIRGDSVWLSTERIVASILDARNPPSRSRRFWYNQIVAAEDAWVLPADVGRAVRTDTLIGPGEPVVAFFDGSKSDDSTGLLVCRLSDGHAEVRGVWQQPAGARGKGWIVPRDDVDAAVTAMFREYRVTAFWADPSDAREEETGERFWEASIDDWHRRYGRKLKTWAVKSGPRQHSIAWDMREPAHVRDFTLAAMRTVSDLESGQVSIADQPALLTHLRNARRRPNQYGVSLAKEHRESRRKIDLAVCLVGARMLRRVVLNKDADRRTGRVI